MTLSAWLCLWRKDGFVSILTPRGHAPRIAKSDWMVKRLKQRRIKRKRYSAQESRLLGTGGRNRRRGEYIQEEKCKKYDRFIYSIAGGVVHSVRAPSDLVGGGDLAWKNYTMLECVSVEIGIKTHSNCSKNKNVHSSHVYSLRADSHTRCHTLRHKQRRSFESNKGAQCNTKESPYPCPLFLRLFTAWSGCSAAETVYAFYMTGVL